MRKLERIVCNQLLLPGNIYGEYVSRLTILRSLFPFLQHLAEVELLNSLGGESISLRLPFQVDNSGLVGYLPYLVMSLAHVLYFLPLECKL